MIHQEVVKIAPRGQIVIPKKFRKALHLEIGNRILVKETRGKLILEKMNFNELAHYEELKQKNVDTGMGVERTVAILNGKDNVFATKLFQPVISRIVDLSNLHPKYYLDSELLKSDLGF